MCKDFPTVNGAFELVKGNSEFGSVALFNCLDELIPCENTIAVCGKDGVWVVTGAATCRK